MTSDLKAILKLVLPEFLVDNFQIINVQDIPQRIDI